MDAPILRASPTAVTAVHLSGQLEARAKTGGTPGWLAETGLPRRGRQVELPLFADIDGRVETSQIEFGFECVADGLRLGADQACKQAQAGKQLHTGRNRDVLLV